MLGLRNFHNFFKITNIYSFLGVLNSNSLLGFILVINLFSLLGLPPLAGFLAKFYLFFNMIGSEFFFLFFISVLSSILSAAIYLKMVRLVLFNKYNNIYFYIPLQREFAVIIAITLIFNIFVFFYSGIILKLIYNGILTALKLSIVYPFIF